MNIYTTTDGYSETVDLDDIATYPEEWRTMGIHELFILCMNEAGTSLFYMEYLRECSDGWGSQRTRVGALCTELAAVRNKTQVFDEAYRLNLMSLLYRIKDETENQC